MAVQWGRWMNLGRAETTAASLELTRPGDRRFSAGREPRRQPHTLCVCISTAFVCPCAVPTQLWLQEHHVSLLPTSDTVQNRLQKHAGQRGSPRPRRRAPHGAQPNLWPFVSYYFTIRSRNGWRSSVNHDGGREKTRSHVSGREALKHCFCFFGRGFSVDLRRGANLRVRRSVWSRRTPSKPGRLHPLLTAAAAQIHGAQPAGWNKKSWMWRLQWETAQPPPTKFNSSLSEVAFTDPGPSPRRRAPAVISAQSQLWITLTRSSQPPRLRFESGNPGSSGI